jgi:hypothetical protein
MGEAAGMKTKLIAVARRFGSRQFIVLALGASLGLSRAEPPASPSDLLEKGIYLEETKGDIDSAMKVYEQAVGAGKSGQSVGAQAQFRLGVCHYKKKEFAEANAAFEKLIKDYPEEKTLAARARDYLGGDLALQPAPWGDGEKLILEIKFPTGFRLGAMSYTADSGEVEGRKTWRLTSQMVGVGTSFSRTEVDADTFLPVHSLWKHSVIGEADASYTTGKAELKVKGKEMPIEVDLAGPVYDNEEVVQMMRRMPLAPGYKTTVKVLPTLTGGHLLAVETTVTGREKVTVPAGTFDCFKVDLSIKQTFWYTTDAHRYLVKFEGGGAIGELVSIAQRKPGEPTQFRSAALGYSLTAPQDWLFFEQPSEDDRTRSTAVALDPEATGNVYIGSAGRESLKTEAQKSVRDWAEVKAREFGKQHKNFEVRADSWKDRAVGAKAGTTFTADFIEGDAKKVLRGVYMFGETNATEFILSAGAKEFDGLSAAFDGIVDSYKSN